MRDYALVLASLASACNGWQLPGDLPGDSQQNPTLDAAPDRAPGEPGRGRQKAKEAAPRELRACARLLRTCTPESAFSPCGHRLPSSIVMRHPGLGKLSVFKMIDASQPPGAALKAALLKKESPERRAKRLKTQRKQLFSTLGRVVLPSILAFTFGFLFFDNLTVLIRSIFDLNTLNVMQVDDSQFIQNFLSVIGLLFSILAGSAYSALYSQQESIYFALFQEVSEAKSLLEQTTLVCAGRPFYRQALACLRDYVKKDLRRLDVPPAKLLSRRPMEDPLESIMYMTSVGVPSVIYETVKNLRQARGTRLGAFQRKFPALGIILLYLLAALELFCFPFLGYGTANLQGMLSLQSLLFGLLSAGHMLVLRIIQELWQSSGGVFNVDEVLQQMVFGLEEELTLRSQQAPATREPAQSMVPLPPYLKDLGTPGRD
mmetsp:Transcript_48745/g.90358  ORF Transcript_48745/g.90358 Transcript_48745/m.90358 type:complete len:431 (+) Transcript_48745:68-1360(+)